MIPLLVIGGITAAVALLAKGASSAAPAPALSNATPAPIGSAVTPTPSTPTAMTHAIEPLFPTPESASLYQAAVAARQAAGIPIVATPQLAPAEPVVPRFAGEQLFSKFNPRTTPPRQVAPAPAPARAPIAGVGREGFVEGRRFRFTVF